MSATASKCCTKLACAAAAASNTPDYSFLAGSRRAFYVETKKPSINIGSSVEPAEQLRSYGWSGDTALGILTNFAEFAVYDCRIEPKQGDFPRRSPYPVSDPFPVPR